MKKIISLILIVILIVATISGCITLFDNFCITEKVTLPELKQQDSAETEKVYYIDLEPIELPETETLQATEPITTKDIVHVESIELDRYSVTIKVGESEMPIVTMLPDNASDKSELWSSDDISVATVNWCGNITGVSVGKCTVTVRSTDDHELCKTVEVTVEAPSALNCTNNEVELLAHLITNEAECCDDYTQRLVASVVLNRMISTEPEFAGKSMYEIIHAPGQYDLTNNFYKPYTDRAYKNAQYIIEHGPICPSSVIFQSGFSVNGSSIWKEIMCPNGQTMYFAHANNMAYYN